MRWIVFGLIIRSAVELEMCRATDFGFSVIALLIKSREAPILRRGVYSRRSSLLGERSKVNFYRGLSECGERIGILASFYPEDR